MQRQSSYFPKLSSQPIQKSNTCITHDIYVFIEYYDYDGDPYDDGGDNTRKMTPILSKRK